MNEQQLLEKWPKLRSVDTVIRGWLEHYAFRLLRYSLAIVFVWFGALKIFRVTPVYDLVASTVFWFDPNWFVPFLGWWEVAVGFGLASKFFLRAILLLLMMQMAGTFLVFVFHPELTFLEGNPLKLSVLGEFVVKNLVLIAAGLVIGTRVKGKA